MTKILVDRVSKYGIMVDGAWVNWSKSFKPIDVRKGDTLEVSLDSKGLILDAVKVSPNIIKPQEAHSERSRDILKGQCLNYAFDWAISLRWDLEKPEIRKRLIELSAVLFAELQNGGYLRW